MLYNEDNTTNKQTQVYNMKISIEYIANEVSICLRTQSAAI